MRLGYFENVLQIDPFFFSLYECAIWWIILIFVVVAFNRLLIEVRDFHFVVSLQTPLSPLKNLNQWLISASNHLLLFRPSSISYSHFEWITKRWLIRIIRKGNLQLFTSRVKMTKTHLDVALFKQTLKHCFTRICKLDQGI